MTDIQGALGLSQIERLDDFISRRHEIAREYDEKLSSLHIDIPFQRENTYSSYHLYPIRIMKNSLSDLQRIVYQDLRKNGIIANIHYIPVHRQPFYENLGFKLGDFPEAERFHREVLTLPMFLISTVEQNKVIKVLVELLDSCLLNFYHSGK